MILVWVFHSGKLIKAVSMKVNLGIFKSIIHLLTLPRFDGCHC
jgi:hypothetical protein